MQLKKIELAFIGFLFLLTGCIKQVTVETRNEKPILVVEGSITTDSIPYTVKLSYSGPYKFATDIPEEYVEKEAKVSITNESGEATVLVHKGNGIYETTDSNYVGKVGSTYQVIVELKDGRKYLSRPEKINQPVPISNISATYFHDNNFNFPASMHVYINSNDPANEENYYKWDFYSWIMRQTHGIPCGFGCVQFEYCYQKIVGEEVRLFSDASTNGKEIKNREVGYSYIYTFGNAFIDIAQQSLTREAYQFWQRYEDQVARTGGILDPLPSSIKGNVFNQADSTDFALGYFFASSVTHRRAILVPFSITQALLNTSAIAFIPDGSKNCFEYFPNTLPYTLPVQYPPPPGWENAERIEVRW
jgi:hypothetical protein